MLNELKVVIELKPNNKNKDEDDIVIANKKDNARIGSSGDYARISKGKIGTWITLAEFDEDNKPICVKSAQVDGKELKEDTYYILQDKQFKECIACAIGKYIIVDGIKSVVINLHKNALKVKNIGDENVTYIVRDGDIYSHGATIKEARE